MVEGDLSPETAQELAALVETLNEKLRAAGANSAEHAFAIGCGAGLLPIVGLILALFLFRLINVILAFTLLVLAILALLGAGMLAASIARTNVTRRIYQETVEPDIARFRAKHNLPAAQFNQLALDLLGSGAPLGDFLEAGGPIEREHDPHIQEEK